jgi:hypothetical protein
MGLFRRLPRAVRSRLERNERVIAWTGADGGPVVATNLGVWLPGRDSRLGWHQIHKVTWGGSRLTVIPSTLVTEEDGYAVMADDEAVDLVLADPADIPAQVRQRVTRSVAYTQHYPLPDGGVRVVGRRVPGVNGLAWHVRYDEGTDVESPDVAATTAELVAAAAGSQES